jgi:4-methyl-5(b-hydroxyethyl)-thiazole monophosphate biosynthesis
MKRRVLCLLTDGIEEIETVTPVDLLRRAGIEVVTAALAACQVTGRSGIRIEADTLLADIEASAFDLLFIPGGPGVSAMRTDGRPTALARWFSEMQKPVAAICAAPLVLMDAGLLRGRRFTAHESAREELEAAAHGVVLDDRVVIDGGFITSRGAGTAVDFGLAIIRTLADEMTADRIAGEIMA